MIIKPCAYCGEMPSEGSTIIHKSGKSLCRVAGTVFTPEQWNNRPGEDAAIAQAVKDERERIRGYVGGLYITLGNHPVRKPPH